MRDWPGRRWVAAGLGAAVTALVIAIPTDLIDTPFFSRDVPVAWWAWPALLASAILAGLLLATYIAPSGSGGDPGQSRAESRAGAVGGVLSLLAVGCPVCNKIVLLTLGAGGAMTWFAPAQPVLAVLSIALLGWALRQRLRGERACPAPIAEPTAGEGGAR
ncbi:MAG TPA: hypothetical protein VFX60_10645 [Micromonospora sp.]|nr:hypothetical protein [Micromonospora sp.]